MDASEQMLSPEMKSWRVRIFASTWLCYAGFYFCRKPFYIVKSDLGEAYGWDASALAMIGTVYLVAYTLGQFAAAWSGNRFGARNLLIAGMSTSIACGVVFGLSNSLGTFMGFMALNGFAQATGWAGTVGTMGNWFRRHERGTVMGFWATCYQWGGVAANGLAAWALGALGFQYSFFAGSLVLLAVLLFFLVNQRNRPEDVGLELRDDDEDHEAADSDAGWSRSVITTVLLIGVFYFFVKFIRYSLWSWVPFLLKRNYGMDSSEAGYLSTVFDLAGIGGVIAAGFVSDRFFEGRRAKVSFSLLLAMVASTVVLYTVGQQALVLFTVSLGLIGFSLYGPDALMTGAAAQDIGGRRATLAAGIINGMGSIGSVAQELVIGGLYSSGEGELGPIFAMLVVAALLAAAALAVVLVRNRMGISDV